MHSVTRNVRGEVSYVSSKEDMGGRRLSFSNSERYCLIKHLKIYKLE